METLDSKTTTEVAAKSSIAERRQVVHEAERFEEFKQAEEKLAIVERRQCEQIGEGNDKTRYQLAHQLAHAETAALARRDRALASTH